MQSSLHNYKALRAHSTVFKDISVFTQSHSREKIGRLTDFSCKTRCTIGSINAAVLPLPVRARARIFLFSKAAGIIRL